MANQFHTKVVGVTFENRQMFIKKMNVGDRITLKRDLNNQFDKNAIMVINSEGNQIGYISKDLAEKIAPNMDQGIKFLASVSNISSNDEASPLGVNLVIRQLG